MILIVLQTKIKIVKGYQGQSKKDSKLEKNLIFGGVDSNLRRSIRKDVATKSYWLLKLRTPLKTTANHTMIDPLKTLNFDMTIQSSNLRHLPYLT